LLSSFGCYRCGATGGINGHGIIDTNNKEQPFDFASELGFYILWVKLGAIAAVVGVCAGGCCVVQWGKKDKVGGTIQGCGRRGNSWCYCGCRCYCNS
jgi:hypothetical protein